MKLELIAVRDRNDKLTGKTIAVVNDTYEKKQVVLEIEKLLDVDYTNTNEHDTYSGFGVSYVIDTSDKKEFKEAYKLFKPLAQDAIDRRKYN